MTPELREACAKAMHVVASNGEVYRGGRGALFILQHNGWGFFARFLRLPPMVWVADLGYWIVASNRPFFGRFLFRRE